MILQGGRNRELENYLYSLPKLCIPTNEYGQNPAHVAAQTSIAGYSLKIICRICPGYLFIKDNNGAFPIDLVRPGTAKAKYIERVT